MVFKSKYNPFPDQIIPRFPRIGVNHPSVGISAAAAARRLTFSPLCDRNLLRGVDGVASIPEAIQSLPNAREILRSGGINLPSPDPRDIFTGLPEFTGLSDPKQILEWLGLPTEVDPRQVLLAAVDDVLLALNITNPISKLCEELDRLALSADFTTEGLIPQLPDINDKIPPTDLPKFSKVTDRLPDLGPATDIL